MSQIGRVIIYGGKGALGSACVAHFKDNNYYVISIDHTENSMADISIVVNEHQPLPEQETFVLESVGKAINAEKVDGVFCVAGGWADGNATKNLIKSADLMWKENVTSALLATSIAVRYLKDNGVLQLTGALPALKPTPNMIGYGLAKNAVHHLIKSLSDNSSGLPNGTSVVGILPNILDTATNRELMPNRDFTDWTPLSFIAELFLQWANGKITHPSGSLVQLSTHNNQTDAILVYSS